MFSPEDVLGLREDAESLMTDTCRITRPGEGEGQRDPATGKVTPPELVVVYEGKCQLKAENVTVADAVAGERELGVVRSTLKLPVTHPEWDTSKVERGHTLEMTGSALDPGLVGKRFTVSARFVGSHNTSRRLPVEAVT